MDNTAKLWDADKVRFGCFAAETYMNSAALRMGSGRVWQPRVAVVSAFSDGFRRQGEEMHTLLGHTAEIVSLGFNQNGIFALKPQTRLYPQP